MKWNRSMLWCYSLFAALLMTTPGYGEIIHVPADQLTIQDAIDGAVDGDTVLVAEGIYQGPGNRDINFLGKEIMVIAAMGPMNTIIDCDGSKDDPHRAFFFNHGEGIGSVVRGFTITNGYMTGEEPGGGILCYSASPSIQDCCFFRNYAFGGGGIYCKYDSSAEIINCIIQENTALKFGGGITTSTYSHATIINCLITHNRSGASGSGISITYGSEPVLRHCTFYRNESRWFGTVLAHEAYPTLIDCIIWKNMGEQVFSRDGSADVSYCNIMNHYEGLGNIAADPMFVSGKLGNYYLKAIDDHVSGISPCIDSGSEWAENFCWNLDDTMFCLEDMTTSVIGKLDENIIDMGFHYPVTENSTDACFSSYWVEYGFPPDITADESYEAADVWYDDNPIPGALVSIDPIAGKMRYVPGTGPEGFIQGSPEGELGRRQRERQMTHILTRSMAVMETEITRRMWQELKNPYPELPEDPSDPRRSPEPDHPVQRVTWYQAILFANLLSDYNGFEPCYFLDENLTISVSAADLGIDEIYCDWDASGYRLPSEGEWEYVCRAGTTGPFSCDEPDYNEETSNTWRTIYLPVLREHAVFSVSTYGRAEPAGSKLPNAWNLKDVHGNVWEWVWDWYVGFYPETIQINYTGPETGTYRILRGGCWGNVAGACRSALRRPTKTALTRNGVGFRLVRTLTDDETTLTADSPLDN
jgi:predicted outer membrane repeat protein